ncbi:hypothetical protein ACERZ8_03800 [Tateyamaria armeniaca]|uniref:Holin n=1 Tax=Tateyamaria armeniaca TaxID=2518930 RepID=A0ABW8UPM3_9RHOB
MPGYLSIELLAAIFGASFQELLYWNSLKKKLSNKSVKAMYKSAGYWIITFLVIGASAIGVMIWSNSSTGYELRDYALMGAAFPALFKLGVNSLSGGGEPKLGAESPSFSAAWRKYFFPERDRG